VLQQTLFELKGCRSFQNGGHEQRWCWNTATRKTSDAFDTRAAHESMHWKSAAQTHSVAKSVSVAISLCARSRAGGQSFRILVWTSPEKRNEFSFKKGLWSPGSRYRTPPSNPRSSRSRTLRSLKVLWFLSRLIKPLATDVTTTPAPRLTIISPRGTQCTRGVQIPPI
jgi:hypothetical protein